jgi:hypothetical protein
MLYSVLIYETPGVADARPSDEREKVLEAHRSLQKDSKEGGTFVAATQLSEAGAITIRHKKNETMLTDGPFAETKELFIGFYIFDVKSLDEAIRLAKRIPVSETGSVEIRPVLFAESDGIPPQ